MEQQIWLCRWLQRLWRGRGFSMFYLVPLSALVVGLVLLGLVIHEQYSAKGQLNIQMSEAAHRTGFGTEAEYSQALVGGTPTEDTLRWKSIIDVVRTSYILDVLHGIWVRQNGLDAFHPSTEDRQLSLEWNDSPLRFYQEVKPLVSQIQELARSNVKLDELDRANYGNMLSLMLRLDCTYALAKKDRERANEGVDALHWMSAVARVDGQRFGFEWNIEAYLLRSWVFAALHVVESGLADSDTLDRLERQLRTHVAIVKLNSSANETIVIRRQNHLREVQHELYASGHLGMHGRDFVLPYLIQLPSSELARTNSQLAMSKRFPSEVKPLESRCQRLLYHLELAIDLRRFELQHGRWPKDEELSDRAKLLIQENGIELVWQSTVGYREKATTSTDTPQEWQLSGRSKRAVIYFQLLPTASRP